MEKSLAFKIFEAVHVSKN